MRYVQDCLDELTLLADTAGAVVVDRIYQERHSPDPATFIGKGKVHQIARKAAVHDANLVIFDDDLTPIQVKNLEREVKKKIMDRSGLILDIFARHARSHEAQTQVELAQLKYLYPRLTRRWTHLSRQEGAIGTRGPGETQLEVDRRLIRKRIRILEKELIKIERQRNVRRRKRTNLAKAALVGYTNTGKSSLMNVLSQVNVSVEDQLFATLDATIRICQIGEKERILLIDTVGFIRKLPHHLVASFRSTLEETMDADYLLHVVDISHLNFKEQIGTVQGVLRNMKIEHKPILTVFNKVDLLSDRSMLRHLKQQFQPAVFTSAIKGFGLNQFKKELATLMKKDQIEDQIAIPIEQTQDIAFVYRMAHVLGKKYVDGSAIIHYRATKIDHIRIQTLIPHSGKST